MHQMHQTSHTRRQNPAAKAQSKSEGQGTRGGGSSWCQEHLIPSSNIPSHPTIEHRVGASNTSSLHRTKILQQYYYSTPQTRYALFDLFCSTAVLVTGYSLPRHANDDGTGAVSGKVLYRVLERGTYHCDGFLDRLGLELRQPPARRSELLLPLLLGLENRDLC